MGRFNKYSLITYICTLFTATTMDTSIRFSQLFTNISDALTGTYTHSNGSINELREEMHDITMIPDCSSDKNALKDDINSFLKDTLKAHEAAKEHVHNG